MGRHVDREHQKLEDLLHHRRVLSTIEAGTNPLEFATSPNISPPPELSGLLEGTGVQFSQCNALVIDARYACGGEVKVSSNPPNFKPTMQTCFSQ